GPVRVFVRPEDLTLGSSGDQPGTGLPGTVLLSSFLGSLRRTSVRLDVGGTVVLQHDVRLHPTMGESVVVRFSGAPVPVEAHIPVEAQTPS
ncbi:MAG: TOBE domain-containing protein, partial [Cryobacterium sp.]